MKRTPLDAWIAAKTNHTDLAAYQTQKLRETVEWARVRSKFYRGRLADAPPITGLGDLKWLRFTTANDIRREPLQLVCVSQDDIHRVVTLDTTGTTGSPKRLYFTREDQELTIDFFHVGMSTFTDPGDRVLILLPGQTPGSVGDLLATALERLGAIPFKYGAVDDPAAVADVIRRESINVLVGVPVHLLVLARTQPAFELKSVLFATDHVPDPIRETVTRTWGCEAYDHYGMTEMGLGGGVECEARRGYHLREADLLFEIIDPQTELRLPDGEYGEIVFTTLTRRGMPLIRYRTGDYGRFLPGACPCGTSLKTLERVARRLNGRIPLGDGHITIAELDRMLFSVENVVNAIAVAGGVTRYGLTIGVQVVGDIPTALEAIRARLTLPDDVKVEIKPVDDIKLTMAKRVIMDLGVILG